MQRNRTGQGAVAITSLFLNLIFVATLGVTIVEASERRFVSINLCADELLISLADAEQIAALSPNATDTTLSFLAQEAASFRHDASSAEQVVEIDPDIVLAGRFTRRSTRDLLARLGYEVVLLDPARTIDDSIAQIRLVADLVSRPQRGEVLIRAIEAARKRALANRPARPYPTAAIYQRRGYVTGGDTLSADLLSVAGFSNWGDELAGRIGGFVSLERLIANPPATLVVSQETT
ncbi:MAG: ABC transporter substrate-binding protein, partial [Alphaproteobacteria bacterium]